MLKLLPSVVLLGIPKGGKMLSFIDCEDMSELKSNEIAAIARYLHVPEIVAVEIGAGLCRTGEGKDLIKRLMSRATGDVNARKA